MKDILVGLILGDLHGRYRYGKTSFVFKQGFIHQEYIYHLYELFIKYCPSSPKLSKSLPDSRTGKYIIVSLFLHIHYLVLTNYIIYFINQVKR